MASVSGTSNVYTQGDITLEFPVEATTTFLFVILISAVLEFGIDTASDVDNKYFKVMFEAINQEVMIVGLLILSCSFAQTVYDFPPRWVLIFQWAMMVLFFMAVFFVLLVSYTLFAVQWSAKRWLLFEIEKMDSGVLLSGREQQYRIAFNRFQSALQAFGYDASMGIRFSEYLAKLNRRNVVALTDLTWVCWVCLGTLVILNALRSEATRQLVQIGDENLEDEQTAGQRIGQYLSFIVVIGYGILIFYLVIHHMLSRRLDDFLARGARLKNEDGPGGAAPAGGAAQAADLEIGLISRDDLEDSKAHLFRRSREATLELLQVTILALEWFTATFFLSFSNEMVTHLGWGVAAPLFVAAAIPVFVFSALLPWTLAIITLLSSLGTNLDEDSVRYLIIKAGIPEADWPPHMREALRRARAREAGEDDDAGAPTDNARSSVNNNASFGGGMPMGNASLAGRPMMGSFAGGLSFVGGGTASAGRTNAPTDNASFSGRPRAGTRNSGNARAPSNASFAPSAAGPGSPSGAQTHFGGGFGGTRLDDDGGSSSAATRPMPRGIGRGENSRDYTGTTSRPLPAGTGPAARTEAHLNI